MGTRPELYYRDPDLVDRILTELEQSDGAVAWEDICLIGGDKRATIDRTLRCLAEFGVIQIVGRYARRGDDTRAVRITHLGTAWIEQTVLPLHGTDPAATINDG